MTELVVQPELDDILEHHGIKGMKWGIRGGKGSTGVSRSSGALMDRNARLAKDIHDARSGTAHRRKVALGRKLVGAEQQNKNWDTLLSNMNAQNKRLTSGQKTIGDRLDKFANVSLLDLVVSVTPKA